MNHPTPYRGHTTTCANSQARLAHQTHHPEHPIQPHTHRHLTITATARIDNRDELVPRLQPHLTTPYPTDAQIILAAHQHWGTDAPRHLIGDYAYVIHDTRTHTLHAARDPMGMCPLYYHHTPQRTALATEIQQLLARTDVPIELHEPAVARHLVADYSALDETFYRGIASLPPGHALEIDAHGARSRCFWSADPTAEIRFPAESDYADRFRELFLRSVRARLRSPGPHGVLLSGGIDSGCIASALGWLEEREPGNQRLQTFSWAFDESLGCDERHLSRIVVDRYGLLAQDVVTDGNGPLARYPDHGPHRDEPFFGAFQALFETALAVARESGVRTMWSGDRGDVINGRSAPPYLMLLRWRQWRPLAEALREHAAVSAEGWPRILGRDVIWPAFRKLVATARGRGSAAATTTAAGHPPWVRADLLSRTNTGAPIPGAESDAAWRGSRGRRHEMVFMPDMMRGMLWSERTNAAFGQAFVDPWSDRRLAEFVLAVPQGVLNRPPGRSKRLARAAMAGIMPDDLRRRATKIVPTPFYHRAMRERSAHVIVDLVTDMEAERRGFVAGDVLQNAVRAYLDGSGPHPDSMWEALSLEMWLRRYWR